MYRCAPLTALWTPAKAEGFSLKADGFANKIICAVCKVACVPCSSDKAAATTCAPALMLRVFRSGKRSPVSGFYGILYRREQIFCVSGEAKSKSAKQGKKRE